jgi:hypothetical protein
MKQEQRRAARKALDTDGVITIDGFPQDVRTMDVAPGGLCIVARKQLPVGKNCHVRFEIPGPDGIRVVAASGHVVYCFFGGDGYKVGLQFMTVHSVGADIIQAYVNG